MSSSLRRGRGRGRGGAPLGLVATFVARTLAPRACAREDTHAAVVVVVEERVDASIVVRVVESRASRARPTSREARRGRSSIGPNT